MEMMKWIMMFYKDNGKYVSGLEWLRVVEYQNLFPLVLIRIHVLFVYSHDL